MAALRRWCVALVALGCASCSLIVEDVEALEQNWVPPELLVLSESGKAELTGTCVNGCAQLSCGDGPIGVGSAATNRIAFFAYPADSDVAGYDAEQLTQLLDSLAEEETDESDASDATSDDEDRYGNWEWETNLDDTGLRKGPDEVFEFTLPDNSKIALYVMRLESFPEFDAEECALPCTEEPVTLADGSLGSALLPNDDGEDPYFEVTIEAFGNGKHRRTWPVRMSLSLGDCTDTGVGGGPGSGPGEDAVPPDGEPPEGWPPEGDF